VQHYVGPSDVSDLISPQRHRLAYRVGLPAKSGVAGGILAIIPGRCSLCVWSPGLDDKGNSIAGIAVLDAFTTLTGWSVF
jgi:glutaminase